MQRTAIANLISFLRKPLFGTIVISRDATVDSSLFPEDSYPVYCPKCSYCLRGLPNGKCPECGTSFKRERLLVKNYVTDLGGPYWRVSTARKWYWGFIIAGIMLPLLPPIIMACLEFIGKIDISTLGLAMPANLMNLFTIAYISALLAGPLCLMTAVAISFKTYPKGCWKRRRAIINAIKRAHAVKSKYEPS